MLKVFEAFSGIGTQRMALRNLGIEHEVVCIAEIDKFAIRSYEAIHGETLNLGDVSKIDPNDVPDHDLFTYSFPCQDISVAGKGKGFKPESGTRSSLLWECEKIIEAKRPKYLLMENVKALIFKKFKPGFEKWLKLLEELGYANYWQVLNAKDYGIPQNRERVFAISIRKDIDTGDFTFPEGFDNGLRLKDFLEDEVDEKFYISQEKTEKLISQIKNKDISNTIRASGRGSVDRHQWDMVCVPCITPDREEKRQNGRRFKEDGDPMFTLTGQDRHGVLQVGNIVNTGNWNNPQRGRVYSENGCSPALNCVGGGGLEPKILRIGNINPNKTGQSGNVYNPNGISPTLDTCQGGNRMPKITEPTIVASRGRNPDNPSDRTTGSPTEQRLVLEPSNIKHTELPCIFDDRDKGFGVKTQDICPTQRAERNGIKCIGVDYRIRKLTPKECWRLMGISDEDFEKAQEVNSNTQLYKQAGNAIVVDVLEGIFRKLFLSKSKEKGDKLEEQLEWLDDLLGVGK